MRRRMMLSLQSNYVWIPLGSGGGGNNYNAVSVIDRTVPIYAVGLSTEKSRLANNSSSFFNRLGLAWEADCVPLSQKTIDGHPCKDSTVQNDGAYNSRLWIDLYDKRATFRKQVGATNSGWINIGSANFVSDSILLENGNTVPAQIYYCNDATKLYSYDTSGPGVVYLSQIGSNADMGYIYILIKRNAVRNSFNWY